MIRRMLHRGPDGEGLWSDSTWIIGHRRLAIVDLSEAGRQPMTTDDGMLVCSVNGEIYNYGELRKTLEKKGLRFRSRSDSEVILHAYRAWGTDSFERLNGMFAFALYDVPNKRMFLVRDRLGIKPLYFVNTPDLFLFASEIKALIAAWPERRWSIDAAGLGQYLTFQNLLGKQSLFDAVRSVPPGHFEDICGDKVEGRAYWKPTFEHSRSDIEFHDAVVQFRSTFAESVGRHLMSDVPVASYLSAGFDSTMVATQAARELAAPPLTYTGRCDEGGGWYDESAGARLVAERIGSRLQEVRLDADNFAANFDDVVHALDEPRMGMGSVSQFIVAGAAAKHGKVILTGHGGDELFSGYPVFKIALFAEQIRKLDPAIFSSLLALRGSEIPHLVYFSLRSMSGRANGGYLPVLFSRSMQERALNPDVWSAMRQQRLPVSLEDSVAQARSSYERILLNYLQIYLPGLLVVEDKISMAHSLESRTPLLDNKMVDLSLRLPARAKLHQGKLKAIVKEAAKDLLPPDLHHMPKRGFPTPLAAWLRGPLSGWMRDRLCNPHSPLRRIFRGDFLERQTATYLKSWTRVWRPVDEMPTHRIWMLLNLESWLRQHEERYGVVLSVN